MASIIDKDTDDNIYIDLPDNKGSNIVEVQNVSTTQMKILINRYYQLQKDEQALEQQIEKLRSSNEIKDESLSALIWLHKNTITVEKTLSNTIKSIVEVNEVGRWLTSITGIGHILAGALLAYLDVEGKEYASQFISYAGLNDNNRPKLSRTDVEVIVDDIVGNEDITDDHVYAICDSTQWNYKYLKSKAYIGRQWDKEKIIQACIVLPYNKNLKNIMNKVGDTFRWNMNNPDSVYGSLYLKRKEYETSNNPQLESSHINARCNRYVGKIFLSHLFEEMYRVKYNSLPPRYYTLDNSENDIEPEVPYKEVTR